MHRVTGSSQVQQTRACKTTADQIHDQPDASSRDDDDSDLYLEMDKLLSGYQVSM
jgi:hypothetical protein